VDCPPEALNLKATTTESCGAIGRGEGIGALATVLVELKPRTGTGGP
jgi:2C-methyl-D-erythritol 2,4-cyclodiphosphate synthase